MSKDKYTNIFSHKKKLLCLLSFKYFATHVKICLRTAYCLERNTFSLERSPARLHEQTNISLILQQP